MTNGAAAVVVSVLVAFFATNTTLIVFLFRQIGKTERGLRAEVNAGRAEMKADMNAGRAEMKADMNAGFDRLQAGQDNLRAEMKADIRGLSRRLRNLETNVTALTVHTLGVGYYLGSPDEPDSADETASKPPTPAMSEPDTSGQEAAGQSTIPAGAAAS